jgi:hypothetical protein
MSDERSNHLWLEQLADFAEGRLAPADVERAQEHLSGCPVCQEELRWLLAMTAALAAGPWQEPPAAARSAVSRAFREAHQSVPMQSPAVERPAAARAGADAGLWQQAWRALRDTLPQRAFQPALLLTLAVLVLFISIYTIQQRQGVSQAETAIPSLVRGDVQVKLAEAEPWQAVETRDGSPPTPFYLHAGAQVATGDDSSLRLTFFEHSETELGEATNVVVEEVQRVDDQDTVALVHRRGRLVVNVEPERGQSINFQIETPTALIQVTGTRFVVTVSADGTTGVEVQEGTVRVTSETVVAEVSAGEAVTVRPGEPPATVTPTLIPQPPTSTPSPTSAPPANISTRPPIIVPPPPTKEPTQVAPPATVGPTPTPPLLFLPTPTRPPLPTPTAVILPTPLPTATPFIIPTLPPPPPTDTPPPPPPTDTPPPVPTDTPPPPPTDTPTPTPTNTPTPTFTHTPTPTNTPTPTFTPTPTGTAAPAGTAGPNPTSEAGSHSR